MMNDSAREELEIKPVSHSKPLSLEIKGVPVMPSKPNQINMSAPPKSVLTRRDTAELLPKPTAAEPKSETHEQKPETAPTLVEFQNKNAALPDWRLKMQNAVRQRIDHAPTDEKPAEPVYQTRLVTSGANALKAEIVEDKVPAAVKNEKVANALKRIEQSRKAFFVEENADETIETPSAQNNKNYPFYVAARTAENVAKPVEAKASVNVLPKPKLVTAQTRNANGELDTNKLPPLAQTLKTADAYETVSTAIPASVIEPKKDAVAEQISATENAADKIVLANEEESEETDDIAPFAMRFNAGLFDLITGASVSMILLAPFMLSGGEWLTFSGFLAFVATISVVMFVYLTTALGMFGRTLGMRLFSLELIDIEENEYPTFHQAAVSSSVYLLSLICGGIGFLTVLFNEEKRAVHDIVSGTIVVKEY